MNGAISLLPYTPSRSVQEEHHLHGKKRHISSLALLNSLKKTPATHRSAYFSAECLLLSYPRIVYAIAFQPPARGPVPGPGINYTGPRDILLELITNLNVILYLSTCHTVHLSVLILFMIMP